MVKDAARGVPGVLATEKEAVRKAGTAYRVRLHVRADPRLSLEDAQVLGGRVKRAVRAALPTVQSVLVHMEPYERAREQRPSPPA